MQPLLVLALVKGIFAANLCCSRSSIENIVEPGRRPTSFKDSEPVFFPSSPVVSKAMIPGEEKADYDELLVIAEQRETNPPEIGIPTLDEVLETEQINGSQPVDVENKLLIGEDLLLKPAILAIKPHDYGVQVAECKEEISGVEKLAEFNKYLLVLQDPIFFQKHLLQLFVALYPGMKQVPILAKDVIGLLLFALIVDRNDREIIATELDLLEPHFSSELLSGFALEFKERDYTEGALKSLLESALQNDCFYTVEAFMSHSKEISFSPDKKAIEIMINYAQMGSSCLIEKHLTAELKEELQTHLGVDSLLPFFVSKNCKSCKLVESPVWSDEDIEAGALASIETSNWVMFKCFVAQKNRPYPFLLPKVLDCVRIVYSDQEDAFELFKQEIKRMPKGVTALVQLMLKLASPEPVALAAFAYLMEHKIASCEAISEALFIEELEYLRIICSHPSVNFIQKNSELGSFGVWEVVRGARRHEEIMDIIINSSTHTIYHALANPDLIPRQWSELLESALKNKPLIASFEDLVEKYGFNEEILTPENRHSLKLDGKKEWSLMHLAVLSLNIPAVEALAGNGFEIDSSLNQIESQFCTGKVAPPLTPLKLAQGMSKQLKESVQLMPQDMARKSLRASLGESHPNFYCKNGIIQDLIDPVLEAKEKCELIIKLLSKVNKP